MSGESLLVVLLVGLIAGWLAGQIVRGTGYGLIADICIGIVGALIGNWLLPRLSIHIGTGIIASIISATAALTSASAAACRRSSSATTRSRTSSRAAMMEPLVRGLVEGGKPPEELAEQVLDAIRAGRFLVLTEPEISKGAVDSRAAALEGSDPTLPLLG